MQTHGVCAHSGTQRLRTSSIYLRLITLFGVPSPSVTLIDEGGGAPSKHSAITAIIASSPLASTQSAPRVTAGPPPPTRRIAALAHPSLLPPNNHQNFNQLPRRYPLLPLSVSSPQTSLAPPRPPSPVFISMKKKNLRRFRPRFPLTSWAASPLQTKKTCKWLQRRNEEKPPSVPQAVRTLGGAA